MPKLIISGQAHELVEPAITIGRSPENALCVNDQSVSGRHAQLQLVGESYHLKDLDSTNGTQVNGNAITTVPLRFGDRVRFGGVDARYEADVGEETQAPPAPEPVLARPAEESARPPDFANASPFRRRSATKDASRPVIFAAAGLAITAFIISMIAVMAMRGPVL